MADYTTDYFSSLFSPKHPINSTGSHPSGAMRKSHASNTDSPEQLCRTALTSLLMPDEDLPETKSIALYHIRCLAAGTLNGEETHGVVFVPEFLYVLDLGYPHLAGVSIDSPRQLYGDPYFPNFANPSFRSIAKADPIQLLYPVVAGELLVSFDEPIDASEARSRLGHKVHDVSGGSGFFEVRVDPFREGLALVAIRDEVSGVSGVQMNQIVRANDISPGWYVDRVL